MIEFKEWPKTPRLFRDMIVTEKIDGTNYWKRGAVRIIYKANSEAPPA